MKLKKFKHLGMDKLILALSICFFSNTGFSQAEYADNTQQLQSQHILEADVSRMPIGSNKTLVHYYHNYNADANPYKLEYDFIQTNHNDRIDLPMKSFLSDMDMYLDKDVQIKSIGNDQVSISNTLTSGMKLIDQKAEYNIEASDMLLVKYVLEMKNRLVVGEEEIIHDGETKLAYVIQSDLSVKKYTSTGELFIENKEVIKDWFIPGYGISKRNRNYKTGHADMSEEITLFK